MERLANSISNKVALELNYNEENRKVIAYGTFAILQMALSIGLVVIFGALFNVVIEALIIFFAGGILRKYSGGVHASSPSICTFIGVTVCVGQAALLLFLGGSEVNLYLVIMLGAIIFIWSYYMIYKLAPVDSLAKPIVKVEKRKRMRKGSMLVLSVYLIIAIFFIALYIIIGGRKFLFYSLCLYSGILWQVFTLTAPGHLFMGKIDTLLSYRN